METIYKIELSGNYGIIFTMTTNGNILEIEEVSASRALIFARMKGLSFMEDTGDSKCYW